MSRHQTIVVQQAPGTSGLAIAGLIFSILGWFTCGLLCIPGAFFCLLALFARGPKGTAVAGLIVGFPGTLFFAFVGLGIIMSFLGIGAAATSAVRDAQNATAQSQTEVNATQSPDGPAAESAPAATQMPPEQINLDVPSESSKLPEFPTPPSNPTDPPAAEQNISPSVSGTEGNEPLQGASPGDSRSWRTWTTADAKHTVDAKFVKFAMGTVTLQKRDGTTVDVKLEILCSDDQDYVRNRRWMRGTDVP